MNELTTTRANPLIDPGLHVWHGEVALYLFLGGLVAGIMIITGLWLLGRPHPQRSRPLALIPWAAPLLLSLGMLFLWLDLENGFNAVRFYMVFRPASPMSWGAWILLLIYPVSILSAWVAMPEAMRERWKGKLSRFEWIPRIDAWARARARVLAAVAVIAGAALGIYTGVLLGTMAARPLWNSAVLGPLFLASGLSTAAAYMLLHPLADAERVALGRLDMGLIVAELALIGLWFAGLASGGAAARSALESLLGGPYTAAFWTLVVALGLLAPLAGEWIEHRRRIVPGRAAAVFVLVGGLALRFIIVYAGQASSLPAVTVR